MRSLSAVDCSLYSILRAIYPFAACKSLELVLFRLKANCRIFGLLVVHARGLIGVAESAGLIRGYGKDLSGPIAAVMAIAKALRITSESLWKPILTTKETKLKIESPQFSVAFWSQPVPPNFWLKV